MEGVEEESLEAAGRERGGIFPLVLRAFESSVISGEGREEEKSPFLKKGSC